MIHSIVLYDLLKKKSQVAVAKWLKMEGGFCLTKTVNILEVLEMVQDTSVLLQWSRELSSCARSLPEKVGVKAVIS